MTSSVTVSGILAGRLWWPVRSPACRVVSGTILPSEASTFPSAGPYPDLRTALVELTMNENA